VELKELGVAEGKELVANALGGEDEGNALGVPPEAEEGKAVAKPLLEEEITLVVEANPDIGV